MRELAPYLRMLLTRRAAMTLSIALLLVTVASALGLLALSGWFITATGVVAVAWAAGQRVFFDIFLPGAGIRFFALSRTVGRYFERVVSHDTALAIQATLRRTLFERMAAFPSATLARLRSSDLLHRMTADIDALDHLLLRVVSPLTVTVALLLLLAGGLTLLAPPMLALPVLLLALAMLPLALRALRTGMLPGHRIAALHERLRRRVLESFDGLAELRSAGTLTAAQAHTLALSQRLQQERDRRHRAQAAQEAGAGLLVQLAAVAALLTGLWLHAAVDMPVPIAVLAALAILGLGELLGSLPQALHQLGETRAAARRLQRLHGVTDTAPEPQPPAPTPASSALWLHDVTLRHAGRSEAVLQQFSLQVAIGEHVAVIGDSATGKSSLVALVTRLTTAERGRLALFGEDASAVTAARWRSQIACLTQDTMLYADSVRANLLLGRGDADDASLWDALHIAALDDVVYALPNGLDTWVGEHGTRLSGGQARRVALARVVLRDAPLVLLDEPFTGLDAATAAIVRGRLETWLRGRTALLFAHTAEALPAADRIVRLQS